MISTVRKIPVLRYALIVSLIVVLFISAFYLYLYYRRAENVRYNVHQMIQARESAAMIDNCLISLYSADNNSRLYSLTADPKYLNQFSAEISFVNKVIDQLKAKGRLETNGLNLMDLVNEKAVKTESYTRLKLLSDSLVSSVGKINGIVEQEQLKPVTIPVVKKYIRVMKIDTIKPVAKAKPRKKKFFARLFDSFSSKKANESQQVSIESQSIPTVVKTRIATRVENMTIVPEKQGPKGNIRQLYHTHTSLNTSEQEILKINETLISQIISNLKTYKLAEQYYLNNGREDLNDSLQDVIFKFKSISGLIFIFLILLVTVILYNIWKIFRNEKAILSYSQNAEKYALSKSAFLASMSHEIRTPLNSVIGFSEQLGQSRLDETQKEQLNAISTSSKLLLEVVNEILDFSKFETGKMSFDYAPFQPYKALEEVFTSLRIQAENKGIDIDMELDMQRDLCLNGDCFRLKQVVINLLSNAIKFTPKGKVTLWASIAEESKGSRVLTVAVQDSGLGISKENLPLIFGEFAQIVSAQQMTTQKGTGLGLAISKKIVEQQGGRIMVTSEPGKGSVFKFTMPLDVAEMSACKKEVPDAFLRHAALKAKHMLIAEDNQLNVLLLTTILKKWDLTYDVAENGKDAYFLFKQNNYDVVLSDIEMPVMNGVELSRLIRKDPDDIKSQVPILALTANVLKEDREVYMKAGINGIVLKPFSEQNLLDTITGALKDPLLEDS